MTTFRASTITPGGYPINAPPDLASNDWSYVDVDNMVTDATSTITTATKIVRKRLRVCIGVGAKYRSKNRIGAAGSMATDRIYAETRNTGPKRATTGVMV